MSLIRNFKLPRKREIKGAFAVFSRKEWIIFSILAAAILVSVLFIANSLNKSVSVNVPMRGGTITEGILGAPRFMNPVLAFSDADKDVVSLVYSGLMRKNPDGNLTPDLAESYEISEDSQTYTFILKEDIYFHDGEPVTADDVVFTINQAKDPLLRVPNGENWSGVGIEKIDDRTVSFTLQSPLVSFLENATLGIMPEHLWNGSPLELNGRNTDPIGSGPFLVKKMEKGPQGAVVSLFLSSFDEFALGRPYISRLNLKFYPNETDLLNALESGDVDQAAQIAPENARRLEAKGYRIESYIMPRMFGLFFNQSENQIFIDKNVVAAISLVADKERIIDEVLYGYGQMIDSPVPSTRAAKDKRAPREERMKEAEDLLGKSGWKKNEAGFLEKTATVNKKSVSTPLMFSISTSNSPDLSRAAHFLEEDLERLGMQVEVKTYELGDLNQSVIRPRKYDALLFGEIVNRESDLFAFWHSSQRKDPGLNVAAYTNVKVDKILEDALSTLSQEERAEKYAQFEQEIKKDLPAVFLYSPSFIYVMKEDLEGKRPGSIATARDRFLDSYLWYLETDNVWKIFIK